MKLKRFLAALTAAAALAALSVLPAQAVTLKWAAQNDVITLDPHSQNHATTNGIMQHVYEGLVRYDKKFQPEPSLATSWKEVSPNVWRFNLRKNVKFHDGSPFTADDVVFSYGRIMQPQGTMQIYVAGVKEVKKIDDYTVDLILSGPNPVLLKNLVDFRIMSKAWCGEEQVRERAGLQGEGRHLRLAQHQRHRTLRAEGLGTRQAHRHGSQRRVVGQARRQRHRGDLHADQVGRHARGGAAFRRRRPGDGPPGAGRRPAAQGPEAEDPRRRRSADDLHRHGPVQRRVEVLEHQGQEPVQGHPRAQGAQPGGGPRGDPARHHARPVDPGGHHGGARRARQRRRTSTSRSS